MVRNFYRPGSGSGKNRHDPQHSCNPNGLGFVFNFYFTKGVLVCLNRVEHVRIQYMLHTCTLVLHCKPGDMLIASHAAPVLALRCIFHMLYQNSPNICTLKTHLR
jgi:hypothetical protein